MINCSGRCSAEEPERVCHINCSPNFQKIKAANECIRKDNWPIKGESSKNDFENCGCRLLPDTYLPKMNINKGPVKPSVQSISLDDFMNDYNVTYRRINQAACLVGCDKNPQSITRTDFVPKVRESSPDRHPEIPMIYREIKRATSNVPTGKKCSKILNYNGEMLIHRDCENSSFKRIMQGTDIRKPKIEPMSVTRIDYPAKPFDANLYPCELDDAFGKYEEMKSWDESIPCFSRALEFRGAKIGKKEANDVDYSKDVNEEVCSFLRVMQAADYRNIDPKPVSILKSDFVYTRPGFMSDEAWESFTKKAEVPLRNSVNMLELYKNIE